MHSVVFRLSLLTVLFALGVAGQAVLGRRAVMVVPIVGKGTWEDPRRPAYVKEMGAEYRWVESDDGRMAIVEVKVEGVGLERAEAVKSAAGKAGVSWFENGKNGKDEVEKELKKLKKDFDLELFLGAKARVGGVK